ncbi:unnamed protein product [Rotaria socialis]|uniref:RUN domain-containing protein n=1 Tax=Rotaria socialis TaxID=392032 RepID=A0A817NB86_9BILA|nr:unnamed protein product [Rotaria socialis]CAF3232066.1 unnamed protein product [Rotaria socialis]CAF3332042.1 unnamed protein product [Rotaria socialis]CAF3371394.1 unnamed protein product [Rotaria socialis]CAF3435135.1 unnamed protein product [Rotaria socialis]
MNDSMINSILLPSSIHLENLEQLIKNLEQQTLNIDNFENTLNNDNNQKLLDNSYLSVSSNTISIDNALDESFLLKSIKIKNDPTKDNHTDESISIDSLSVQRDLFIHEDLQQQNRPVSNDQSLCQDHDSGFTWDDQYDTQANYCIAFNIDKSQELDSKYDKSSRSQTNQKSNSVYSDDEILSNMINNINDWSMRSDCNAFEQPINRSENIHSQFHLPSSTWPQSIQNNNASGSSTSWRQMKQNQRATTQETDEQETRPLSPINLYKIFQQKSNAIAVSPRIAFQPYRQQNDASDKMTTEKSTTSQSHSHIDQANQTSIHVDSSLNNQCQTTSPIGSKSKSYDNLNLPCSAVAFSINKSLPDLSFISQYSKELPRSQTTSPVPRSSSLFLNAARTTSSPTLVHLQKHDSDRPRTLKSIKRYKNSKHSTEPLGAFYSPQLRNTSTSTPNSTAIKMKLPSPSSIQSEQQQKLSLKSCLKYQSRANSCDIQVTLRDQKPRTSSSSIPTLSIDQDSNFRSRIDGFKSSDAIYSTSNCPNNINSYQREHHSEYDLPLLIEQVNQTKKSVSFSGNISKHALSSSNASIAFNENKDKLKNRTIIRHGEMRRCQTDIIHIDPVLHRYTFNDSPPNEFCLQQDDDILMEESYGNVDEPLEENIVVSSSPFHSTKIASNENETNLCDQPMMTKNVSIFDYLLETIVDIIKRLFEIKQSEKSFFLNNENNLQLDSLLKNEFCTAIQNILEHGRKDFKKITLWKIIEMSMSQNSSSSCSARQVPEIYSESKTMAQHISSNWLYRFQAFIFQLLNKNELINWLYYFTRQKDIIQYYYQPPDALVLVSIPATFNLFERIMTQLEKLTPLAFQLTYHVPNASLLNDDQLSTSMISVHSSKANARNWLMSISRRTSKNLTHSIVQNNSNETIRSTLTKKFSTLFSRTNPQQQHQQRKSSSVVTTKLPEPKQQPVSSEQLRRLNQPDFVTNSLATATTNKSIVVSNEKLHGSIPRNVASTTAPMGILSTFQTKMSRTSLNIDTPKSTKYHTKVPLLK